MDTTVSWWTDQVVSFHPTIDFDGIWIDMNEPANFIGGTTDGCVNNSLNYPPYAANIGGSTNNMIFDKTLCGDCVHSKGTHYDMHNMYGHFEARATNLALQSLFPGKRPMILTRSNYAGTGKYSPAHWLGDNYSTYESMRDSIPGILEFNLFGIPFTGSDICGFQNNCDSALCLRWMQLGAFYPFSRNHNTAGATDQDPASFGSDVINASIKALTERYRLLPYLYTLLFRVHLGEIGAVWRSLMHEFPAESGTYDVHFQFMWGSGLLISPVVEENMDTVLAYIPTDRWYDYFTGDELTTVGMNITISAPTDGNIPLHIRGGYILPRQDPELTTAASRLNPLNLLVALDAAGSASGSLIWDDGVSNITDSTYDYYNFNMENGVLTTTVEKGNNMATGLYYSAITLYGYPSTPSSITVDSTALSTSQYTYNSTSSVLSLTGLSLDLTAAHTVQFA
jgi:maltase-glucoamylase